MHLILYLLSWCIIIARAWECTTFSGQEGHWTTSIECFYEWNQSTEVQERDSLNVPCEVDFNGNVKVCCPWEKSGVESLPATCGKTTIENKSPWLAALGQQNNDSFQIYCTGVLISDLYVLGNSDCLDAVKESRVSHAKLGTSIIDNSHDGKSFIINEAIGHKKLSLLTPYKNNIALFKLETRVQFDSTIRPICLPRDEKSKDLLYLASMWEIVNNPEGLSVSLTVPSTKLKTRFCNKIYASFNLTSRQVCTYHKRFCDRYAVQPVLISVDASTQEHSIVGVGSIEPQCDKGQDIPEVYTNVLALKGWIKNNMQH